MRPSTLVYCVMPWVRRVAMAALLAGSSAAAQESYDPYDLVFGAPVDVPLADLAQGAASYQGRPVRTKGYLELYMGADVTTRQYCLRDAGFSVLLVPRPEVMSSWEFSAMTLLGARVQVVGFYQPASSSTMMVGPAGALEFWKYVQMRDDDSPRARAREVPLATLVQSPARQAGKLVRVVGEFRGRNLFGDLPASSQRSSQDWVLRDGAFALWVTGRPPRGSGFSLDPTRGRDSGKWLEVVGRVEVAQGTVYLRASSVDLGQRPVAPLVTPTETVAAIPKTPPIVVFSLPLDGEQEIASDTRIAVQFSKDMDETSFAGRLRLRYADGGARTQAEFPRFAARYDAGRRALMIDPGDRLVPGRRLELLLLAGIKDIDGLELVPRSGVASATEVDVLRFGVGF